jgi:WD40 repeat protein
LLPSNRLASGSADSTIKLWDVCTQACVATLNTHKSKVQTVQFHATEQHLLLSSGFDQKACVTDLRTPDRVAFSFKCSILFYFILQLWSTCFIKYFTFFFFGFVYSEC